MEHFATSFGGVNSVESVQACKIKPNKMTVEQDNKVQRIH